MREEKNRLNDYELINKFINTWRITEFFRGNSTSNLNQIISLLGYKYLSENVKGNKKDIGYELNENLYYENLLINKGNVIETLKEGIAQITQNNENIQSADVFYDLFDLIDFETFKENDNWLRFIELTEKLCSETTATIGEIIIFITKYIIDPSKSSSPKPSKDIIKLITANQGDVKNIYDPYAEDGTLLAEIGKVINIENYYGQHPRKINCILAKMTLLTNDVNYKNIFIKCNDIQEMIKWNVKFDLCVSIPPFGHRIILENNEDPRFKPFIPNRTSELAYLLDMLYNLDDAGTIKIILSNGVLMATPYKKILKHLVDNELISSIIGLPGGMFEITSIETAILTVNKKPVLNGIYYLDIRHANIKSFLKRKLVSIEDINKYVNLFINTEEHDQISKIASIEDMQENDYNLSINRYVGFEKFKTIDINQTITNILEIKKELKQIDQELNMKLGELYK